MNDIKQLIYCPKCYRWVWTKKIAINLLPARSNVWKPAYKYLRKCGHTPVKKETE